VKARASSPSTVDADKVFRWRLEIKALLQADSPSIVSRDCMVLLLKDRLSVWSSLCVSRSNKASQTRLISPYSTDMFCRQIGLPKGQSSRRQPIFRKRNTIIMSSSACLPQTKHYNNATQTTATHRQKLVFDKWLIDWIGGFETTLVDGEVPCLVVVEFALAF
jgi:hypothetical protein